VPAAFAVLDLGPIIEGNAHTYDAFPSLTSHTMSDHPSNRTNGADDIDGPVAPDEALRRLMEGNARFLAGRPRFTHTSGEVLADLAKEQRPFATILGCSDSRVPPELIFDAGFGSLFIVRVAGHVVSPGVAGSLQYAGTHLGTQLLMVLGHEGCGAVQAALASKLSGAVERSRIEWLLQNVVPGLDAVDRHLPPRQQMEHAVEANVRWTIRQIVESPEGHARGIEGRMKIVGAVCTIATGEVRLLDPLDPVSL
jgi:carbonic anhydrase